MCLPVGRHARCHCYQVLSMLLSLSFRPWTEYACLEQELFLHKVESICTLMQGRGRRQISTSCRMLQRVQMSLALFEGFRVLLSQSAGALQAANQHLRALLTWEQDTAGSASELGTLRAFRKLAPLYLHGFASAARLRQALLVADDLSAWDAAITAGKPQ